MKVCSRKLKRVHPNLTDAFWNISIQVNLEELRICYELDLKKLLNKKVTEVKKLLKKLLATYKFCHVTEQLKASSMAASKPHRLVNVLTITSDEVQLAMGVARIFFRGGGTLSKNFQKIFKKFLTNLQKNFKNIQKNV